jgi:hypothetical protein
MCTRRSRDEAVAVEQDDFERARQLFEDEVRARLAGEMIDEVELLRGGHGPEELLGKIFIAMPAGANPADMTVRRQAYLAFRSAHREALAELRRALGVTSFGGGLLDLGFPSSTPASARGPVVNMKMPLGRARGR